jgi:type I restriction enzyme M protein
VTSKSAADFAFLLHGFHYLKDNGVMAIILPHGVLFRGGADHFVKGKRQNQLSDDHISAIVNTYKERSNKDRYSRRVSMDEIVKNDYNLNISRYVSTAVAEEEINLRDVHKELVRLDNEITKATKRHNAFLKELGLKELPG